MTQAATTKVGQDEKNDRTESRMIIAIIIIPAAVFVLLTGIIIVSIAWTHRPDLTISDILREGVRVLRERNMCWQKSSGKEKKK